jgi:hypothetical protein
LGARLEQGHTAEVEAALSSSRTVPDASAKLAVPVRTLQHWLATYPILKAAMLAGRDAAGLDARGYRKIPTA